MKKLIKDIKLKLFLRKARKNYKTGKGKIYEMGGGWGNAINWTSDYSTPWGSVVGWKSRKPKVGDYIFLPMKSGRVLVTVFTEVRYCNDPNDMFFGTIVELAYSDELKGK